MVSVVLYTRVFLFLFTCKRNKLHTLISKYVSIAILYFYVPIYQWRNSLCTCVIKVKYRRQWQSMKMATTRCLYRTLGGKHVNFILISPLNSFLCRSHNNSCVCSAKFSSIVISTNITGNRTTKTSKSISWFKVH